MAAVKKSTSAGPKPSAGPRILGDLGITDAELAAFLPPDAPRFLRGVFWCQFEHAGSLDDIAAHFALRFKVARSVDLKFPPDGPEAGIEVDTLTLVPTGRYVAYMFYAMRGERYGGDGCFQLEAAFQAMGTAWGSNRAVYERFKAVELRALGVTSFDERTE